MVAVMCRDMNAYSFGMTDSLLLFRWTVYSLEVYAVCSECLAFYGMRLPDWPLLYDWQLSGACHSGGASDYLYTTGQFMPQSC